jgi:hypothetical protein
MIIIPLDQLPLAVRRQLQQLKPGETASIVQDSEQVAEVTRTRSGTPALRPIGLCKGQFVLPDSFFDPLPEDIQKAFEGGS